ncbi:MAG: hypothetical protein UT33_C0011G0204 [Candidatus Peregrinibacteria bacterium GW2011_GWC2_39_14]|nr:MAG: hypothetical protein UT33_C0011G0204 [Candidatus Peregrinibacteria bacterium GW2011_GWC2_39_14]
MFGFKWEFRGVDHGRRDVLRGALGAGVTLVFGRKGGDAFDKQGKEEKVERKMLDSFDDLKKSPEDVYLLLFEPDNRPGGADDFIADGAKAVGYAGPNHWHSEVMYFDQAKRQWMVMGCRPPTCTKDYPLGDLLKNPAYKNCPINIKHAKVPVDRQLEARKWFTEHLQGEVYKLSGPDKTNCSDAAAELAKEAKMDGVEKIEVLTRRRLLGIPGLSGFLQKYQIGNLDQFLRRDDLLFPDELESLGKYVGTIIVR